MKLELTLKQWGNGTALRIPAPLRRELGIDAGAHLLVELVDGKLVITPRPRPSKIRNNPYTVEMLMAGGDPEAPMPDDMKEFLTMKPVGLEILE